MNFTNAAEEKMKMSQKIKQFEFLMHEPKAQKHFSVHLNQKNEDSSPNSQFTAYLK